MKITYKNRGFGNYEAWYKANRIALITSTYGRQAEMGRFRVLFSATNLDTYVLTLAGAKDTVQTFVEDLTDESN
jgi:hypothetical protein